MLRAAQQIKGLWLREIVSTSGPARPRFTRRPRTGEYKRWAGKLILAVATFSAWWVLLDAEYPAPNPLARLFLGVAIVLYILQL
jgi:hypothetical protein